MGKDNAVFISEMSLHALTEVADAFQQRDLPHLIQETDTPSCRLLPLRPSPDMQRHHPASSHSPLLHESSVSSNMVSWEIAWVQLTPDDRRRSIDSH